MTEKEPDRENLDNPKNPPITTSNKKNKEKKEPKEDDLNLNPKNSKKFVYEDFLSELITKKTSLETEINSLEQKKEILKKEIESSFEGQSDNIAKKVRGFQDYLSGALQNLSLTVEKLELVSQPIVVKPSPLDKKQLNDIKEKKVEVPALSETFKPDEEIIRNCFSSFTEQPDFYADPWKLRRSLNSTDIEILDDWFFNLGGRGAIESLGSRPKNALLTAGLISTMGELYGDQFQTLILASEPERLGEWRRVLQDSLGLAREDFGPSSGIVLFERAEGVIERADRLEENNEVPLIIVDASETSIDIPILQFPLWIAFVGSNDEIYDNFQLD